MSQSVCLPLCFVLCNSRDYAGRSGTDVCVWVCVYYTSTADDIVAFQLGFIVYCVKQNPSPSVFIKGFLSDIQKVHTPSRETKQKQKPERHSGSLNLCQHGKITPVAVTNRIITFISEILG